MTLQKNLQKRGNNPAWCLPVQNVPHLNFQISFKLLLSLQLILQSGVLLYNGLTTDFSFWSAAINTFPVNNTVTVRLVSVLMPAINIE